ncbi:tetratricopeptide repeat protein [Clostridium sp. WILCCON 0269]|uniref:Tetratricopeptide repeat protein n=1 Tax=Candidatus Clostridium eludens TaxID=3381663 RepID=A0ABW8SLP5_9CLOT
MAFRDKRGISSKLFSKMNLKTKGIVFCILCIFAVALIIKIAYDNKYKNTGRNLQSTRVEDSVIKKQNSSKIQDEHNKELEQKYKEAEQFFSNKQYANTIAKADEMINEDSTFYKAYNIKGIALCYSNNYEEGMNNIDKSLKLNPDFGYARFNKALAYELYGKYEEALNWYDKALEVENYIWSYYGKASIYGRRGDVSNTVKFLRIAINMSSDIKNIAKEEADFNPVKNSKEFQDLVK